MVTILLDNGSFANILVNQYPASREIQSLDLKVVLINANPGIQKSLRQAEALALSSLHHISKIALPVTMQLELDFGSQAKSSILGESAGLAFYIALAEKLCNKRFETIAATGMLNDDGRILKVERIHKKLEGYTNNNTGPFLLFVPSANKNDINKELRSKINSHHGKIEYVDNLTQVLKKLFGIYTSPTGSPYRGLNSFEFQDHDLLFGRDDDKMKLLKLLGKLYKSIYYFDNPDKCLFLTVLGRSGIGKSSFVKAALLPLLIHTEKLPYSWPDAFEGIESRYWAVICPSDNRGNWSFSIANSFYRSIDEAFNEGRANDDKVYLLSALLESDVFAAIELMQSQLSPGKTDHKSLFVLVVDQFERLFSLEKSHLQRQKFINCLIQLANKHNQCFAVIIILQSDYYAELENYNALLKIVQSNGQGEQYHLHSLGEDSPWLELIQGPANIKGIQFETRCDGTSLADEIRHDVLDLSRQNNLSGNILPWLQFTLTYLYIQAAKQKESGKVLTFNDYHQKLGGIKGALANRAEEIFQQLDKDVQDKLSPLLDLLVRLDNRTHTLVPQPIVMTEINSSPVMNNLIQAFVQGNLLHKYAEAGQKVLVIAHLSLLDVNTAYAWHRIIEWKQNSEDKLLLADRVENRYQQYQIANEKDKKDHLLRGSLINDGKKYLVCFKANVTNEILNFIKNSIRIHKKHKIVNMALSLNAFLVVSVLGIIAYTTHKHLLKTEAIRDTESMYFSQKISTEIGRFFTVKTTNCQRDNYKFDKIASLKNHIKENREKLDKNTNLLIPLLQNQSTLEFKRGKYSQAIKTMENLIKRVKNKYGPKHKMLALNYYNLAWLEYRNSKFYDYVIKNNGATLLFNDGPNFVNIAFNYTHSVNPNKLTNEFKRSIQLLYGSLSILNQHSNQCLPDKASIFSALSWLYTLRNDKTKAFKYRIKAIKASFGQMSKEINRGIELRRQGEKAIEF